MIIRMTVRDNDYTQFLESFSNGLFNKIYFDSRLRKSPEELGRDLWWELNEVERKVQELLNPNITESLTTEAKTILKAVVFDRWCKFVDACSKEEHVKDYLKKTFKVSFGYTFTDKWENGEVVYYFTTAQKWISQ